MVGEARAVSEALKLQCMYGVIVRTQLIMSKHKRSRIVTLAWPSDMLAR